MEQPKSIRIVIGAENIVVPDGEDAKLLAEGGYGTLADDGEGATLHPYEALYLLSEKRAEVEVGGDKLDFPEFLQRLREKDPDAWTRYLLYRDLRSRGYVVRDGFGFGLDFRVYERGEYGEKPAKYVVYGVQEGSPLPLEKMDRILTFVKNIKRELILGVIDRRGEMVYYEVSQLNFSQR